MPEMADWCMVPAYLPDEPWPLRCVKDRGHTGPHLDFNKGRWVWEDDRPPVNIALSDR